MSWDLTVLDSMFLEQVDLTLEKIYDEPIYSGVIDRNMVVVHIGSLEEDEFEYDIRRFISKEGDKLYVLQIFHFEEKPSDMLMGAAASEVLYIAEWEVYG